MLATKSNIDIKDQLIREANLSLDGQPVRLEYVIPILNGWVLEEEGQSLYVLGTIHNHAKYPSGSRIRTSKVINYQKINHRNMISTRNSIYELGEPAIQLRAGAQNTYQDLQHKITLAQPNVVWRDVDLEEFTRLSN